MANSNPTGKPISTKLCYRYLHLVEQMNRHTVDLGFIQSRAEVTAVFENVDKWVTAVFVNGLGIN